jgi:hypothetical protein
MENVGIFHERNVDKVILLEDLGSIVEICCFASSWRG